MKAALITVAVFAALFAPFFLLLAVLRFVPPEKRLRIIPRPVRHAKSWPPWLAPLLEGLSGLF
jgi:hypothetical protein